MSRDTEGNTDVRHWTSNKGCDNIASVDIVAAEQIAQDFAPLGFALHDVMPRSIGMANEMMKHGGMEPSQYRSLYIHNIVGCSHSLLRTSDIGDWQLNRASRKKELHLTRELWTMRLLSATFDQGVPTAGRNKARQAFYSNPPVTELTGQQALLEQHDFLVIWNLNDEVGEVELELVHTLGPWRYGQRERVDLRMPLVGDQADLSNLKFTPAADDDLEGLGLIDPKGKYQRGVIDGRSASS